MLPMSSGTNHDKRQDFLQREGLNKPKQSTLLGIGSADLASSGVEDMFSKAIYDPAKACAVEGLVETSVPGRYTPRKVAAISPRTVASASVAAYNAVPPLTNTGGQPSSSTAASGAVFRVIPTGLGNSSALVGRGGASVPGIAPVKRLCGSRSAPTLRREPRATEPTALSGTGASSSPPQSQSTCGGSGRVKGRDGGDPISGPALADGLETATGAMNVAQASTGDSMGNASHTKADGTSSRGLRRSRSDLESSSGGSFRGTGTAGEGFMRKSASAGRVLPLPIDGFARSLHLRSSRSRGASPAQRRHADQLALDFAAVRLLEQYH